MDSVEIPMTTAEQLEAQVPKLIWPPPIYDGNTGMPTNGA